MSVHRGSSFHLDSGIDQRESTATQRSIDHGHDGRWFGTSNLLHVGRGAGGRHFFLRDEVRPEESELSQWRPLRSIEGPCSARALRGAGRSRRVSAIAPDDASPVFKRTGRAPDAADSGRRCSDGLAGPGSVGGGRPGDRLESRQDSDARLRAGRRRRNGRRPDLGGGGICGLLQARQLDPAGRRECARAKPADHVPARHGSLPEEVRSGRLGHASDRRARCGCRPLGAGSRQGYQRSAAGDSGAHGKGSRRQLHGRQGTLARKGTSRRSRWRRR